MKWKAIGLLIDLPMILRNLGSLTEMIFILREMGMLRFSDISRISMFIVLDIWAKLKK